MTKKTAQITVAAIAASLMASLAPVPAQSTTLPSTAVEEVNAHHGVATSLTFNLPSGQIFLPIEEAADYLNQINEHQRFLLNGLVRDRQGKGKGSLAAPARMKRLCDEGLKHHMRVKEAIQLVMKGDNLHKTFPGDLEQQAKYKAALLRFGRAIAQGEFILRDTLSFIEQSKAPERTVRLTEMPDDEEVKSWINAEHKKLGLQAPEWS